MGHSDTTSRSDLAEILRRRAHVRGEPVGVSLFRDTIPASYVGREVEPCAIVRHAMDLHERVYVDADHHSCLAGAWQAGFITPPEQISSGSYLVDNTPFFSPEGAHRVKNGLNVLPSGTVRGIGAAPLDRIPDEIDVDVIVVVCEPAAASMLGGVRVAVDGVPPTGAAGTSLCGDLFALPYHDPNVVISTGDVGGRMFNKIRTNEMFVIVPWRWAYMIPRVMDARPDLGGLMEAIKPGYRAERDARRAAHRSPLEWDDDVEELLALAPDAIREFAGPTLEEYAREHGHVRITMSVMSQQMDSVGMRLEDVIDMVRRESPGAPVEVRSTDGAEGDHGAPSAASLLDELGPAPVRASASVVVNAGADSVYRRLADAGAWSLWYPDIRDVSAREPLAPGVVFSFRTGPAAVKAVVDHAEEPFRLGFTGRSRGSTSTYLFEFIESDGITTVRAAQTMAGPAVRTMRPLLQRIATTSLPHWLEALRAVEGPRRP